MQKHLNDFCIAYKRLQRFVRREAENSEENRTDAGGLFQFVDQVGPMTANKLRDHVLRIIIAENLSFSSAENSEFVRLLKKA